MTPSQFNSDSTREFTAHNIRLDDGTVTMPMQPELMTDHPWFRSARRALSAAFGDQLLGRSIVDLGCLEGGYTTEFARLGMNALGIEIRQLNFENCVYVRNRVNLKNLNFVRDDVWNLGKYGPFDAIFCCGILYHLDRPREFLRLAAESCRKIIILQTHFATAEPITKFSLSPITAHEGLPGRWFGDYPVSTTRDALEKLKWCSWGNPFSYWIQKEYLIEEIKNNGFDMVFEQYDCLPTPIAESITTGYYKTDNRCMFVGIRSDIT